ncbi:outer membrane lipoprotein-sorting protein [Thalassomonas viridans]|uniref:Outer membrane lipoprotein-sorting protein n=1 Tax=Thalassomonas viridans TaxID=137584 RepID=A0AAF0CF81_9GAMM|nr:outer membrane lipoprotein-sorting protein [Thalassomonas viridans]WDE09104.1 outer membrane lipoprotein-sorting protein [Thalassomonas viridans]
MKKFTKVLLPLGLVWISPALLAAAEPTTVNAQITDAVEKPAIAEGNVENKVADTGKTTTEPTTGPVTGKEAVAEPAVKVQEGKEQTSVVKADSEAKEINAEPDAQQLLEFIDSLRGYQDQSFTFDLSNVSFKDNEQKHRNKLAVKVLSDASLVEFTAPARSKGRKILKQAQNMWIRFPGTRNVLRISPAQRLLGEASNGDVTGTNFSQDYSASYEGMEMLDDKQVLKLKLDAKHDKATYKQVMFYLDSENKLPLRSDFYARSGKLAKQAYYTMFKEFDGDLKLHRMKLVDPIMEGSYTWMMFDNYQKQELDAAIFHKDALTR